MDYSSCLFQRCSRPSIAIHSGAGRQRELMTTPIGGDMTEGEPAEGYLVFQGGLPEIQDFLKSIWT